MNTQLQEARVLVTGAAGGIGAACAQAFAAAGAAVAASDRAAAGLPDIVAGWSPDQRPAALLDADLAVAEQAAVLVDRAAAALGGLDAVAHFAGLLLRASDLDDVGEADWDAQHDVNLKSTFFLLRRAGALMRRQGHGGRLLAATSQSWWSGGLGGSVAYAASKGGVVSLCRGLARTYGPDGITVNTIAPGAIDTPMLLAGLDPAVLERTVEATPLGRLGRPEEVADVAVFLCSPQASFITAATINVSGGWLTY